MKIWQKLDLAKENLLVVGFFRFLGKVI